MIIMTIIKKYIPLALVTIVGLFTLATYYVPSKASLNYLATLNQWQTIVSGFAFLLGLISLLRAHFTKIQKHREGWGYSLFVFIGFFAVVIAGVVSHGSQVSKVDASLLPLGWVFRYLYNPLCATMFAVLAFYIVSTAFRSFRIKSVQAFVLFVAAFILIFGNVPLGQNIWNGLMGWTHCGIDQVIQWIMDVPSVAAKRGIMIGITIGAVVTSLKIIFGIERQYMGRD